MASRDRPKSTSYTPLRVYARILSHGKPHWRELLFAALLMLVAACEPAVLAWLIKQIFDALFDGNGRQFVLMFALSLGVRVLAPLAEGMSSYCAQIASARAVNTIREDVYRHLYRLPMSFFYGRESGDMMSAMLVALPELSEAVGSRLLSVAKGLVATVAVTIAMIFLNPLLGGLCCGLIPMVWLLGRYFGDASRQHTLEYQRVVAQMGGHLLDTLHGMETAKLDNLASIRGVQFGSLCRSLLVNAKSLFRTQAMVSILSGMTQTMGACIGLGGGGYLVLTGKMTMGEMIAFLNLVSWILWPFSALPMQWCLLKKDVAFGERVFEILDAEPEIGALPAPAAEVETSLVPQTCLPAVEFVNVTFGYADRSPIVGNLDLTIPMGQKVGVVGPNGAGKSTLIRLLLGFLRPLQGQVRVFGRDVRGEHLEQIRSRIAAVTQTTSLFGDATIRENIRYGRPEATDTEVLRAAEKAMLLDLIGQFEQKLGMGTGAGSLKLSGGQRQKVQIARALLKEADLIIFDEATAWLDSESQEAVVNRLCETDKTCILISHRMALLRRTDVVVFLPGDGRVVAGTHGTLMKSCEPYREFLRQSQVVEYWSRRSQRECLWSDARPSSLGSETR